MDKKYAVGLLLVLQFLVTGTSGAAQVTPAAAEPRQTLRVYLDCHCDFDYIRREIPFVNYVRDRQVADVHLLVTRQGTGGGEQFKLNYIGLGRFAAVQDTLIFDSPHTNTEELERQGLVRTMKLGIMRFMAGTPEAGRLDIRLADADEDEPGNAPAPGQRDPWNFWNFRVGIDGNLDREEREQNYEFEGSFDANRTTENWKMSFSLDGEKRLSEIELDDRTVDFETHNWEASGLVVKTLGGNFAAGVGALLESSVFQNYDLALRVAPAIEYNFFPYSESSRRAFVVRYYFGVAHLDYQEQTIFFKNEETLLQQALAFEYDLQQTWGESSVSAEVSNYLHNFRYNRIEIDGRMSVNLFRGFSFNVGGGYERIRDQLSVPAEGETDEDVLLERRQRLTGYRLGLHMGLSYRFGSIFNNVVNPRMNGF